MNKDEFRKFIASLEALYPKQQSCTTAEAKNLWYLEIKHISYEEAMGALREWYKKSMYSPALSEFLTLIAPKEEEKKRDNSWLIKHSKKLSEQLLAKYGSWENFHEHMRQDMAQMGRLEEFDESTRKANAERKRMGLPPLPGTGFEA